LNNVEVMGVTTIMKITTRIVLNKLAAVTLAVTVSVSVTPSLLSTHTVTKSDTQLDGDIRDSAQCSVTMVQSTFHVVTHAHRDAQDITSIPAVTSASQ